MAIDYIKKEGTLEKNLFILLKHGQKLLTNSHEATQRFIKELVLNIISQNSLNPEINYKYEKLIKIYINQEKLLEDLLDFIILKDEENCSNTIIHR